MNSLLSKNIASLFKFLNKDETVLASGFAVGFLYEFKFNKKTLEQPLSTIFSSSISGLFCSFGAVIVGSIVPPHMKFIIPVTSVVACGYYKYLDYKSL